MAKKTDAAPRYVNDIRKAKLLDPFELEIVEALRRLRQGVKRNGDARVMWVRFKREGAYDSIYCELGQMTYGMGVSEPLKGTR